MADDTKTSDDNLANEVGSQLHGTTLGASLVKNPKRVIRTFASDFAKLSGTKPPSAAARPTPPPAAPAKPAAPVAPTPVRYAPQPVAVKPSLSEAVAGIHMPREEALRPLPLPPAPRPQPQAPVPLAKRQSQYQPPPREEPQEARIVSEKIIARGSRSQESFWTRLFQALLGHQESAGSASYPQPSMPAPRPIIETPRPAPPPEPAPVMQFNGEEKAESAEDREAVLARLRARVASYQIQNPAPAPVFPAPRPEPAARRPAPAPLPRPLPAPIPEPLAPERLETYSNDFSNRIDKQQASVFSVLAAQSDAGKSLQPSEAPTASHGFLYAVLATVLVVGGSLALYFAYNYFSSNAPVMVSSSGPKTLIAADDSTSISGTGSTLMNALAQTATEPLTVGNVRTIYLSVSTTTGTGTRNLNEPGGALIAALDLPAPDILLRNISLDSTVGIVHAGEETRPFFILDADSYERVFAGMLAWEPDMGSDLGQLYPPYEDMLDTSASTTTATTTTATSTAPAAPAPSVVTVPGFVDEVVASHDVRALKDSEGRTVLLYGFRDQNTLIIARDETSFIVLLARLSATGSQ